MDTTRIIINQIDSSTVSVAEDTTVTGFTVVKAPKGPITPIYVSAGSSAEIKDIFGSATGDYPDLFEANTFNGEYGLYISAPYTEAGVPFAVVTGDGICKADCLLKYNTDIEDYVAGRVNSIDNMEFLNLDGTPIENGYTRLFDTRYAKSYGFADNAVNVGDIKNATGGHAYPGYDATKQALYICTGLPVENVEELAGKKLIISNLPGYDKNVSLEIGTPSNKRIRTYKGILVKKTDGTFAILPEDADLAAVGIASPNYLELKDAALQKLTTEDGTDKLDSTAFGQVSAFYANVGGTTTESAFIQLLESEAEYTEEWSVSAALTSDDDPFVGSLEAEENHYTGDSDPAFYVRVLIKAKNSEEKISLTSGKKVSASDYVKNYLSSETVRTSIRTNWSYIEMEGNPFESDDVKAFIFPKYPSSDRVLHLSFGKEDLIQGYDFSTVDGRNVLKITAYEEGAFHGTSAQAVSVTGSLDDTYKDAYGAYISFSSVNSSYASQELFAVYAKGKFTDPTEFNTLIKSYAPVELSGGIRKLESDTVDETSLYNIGWEQAKSSDLNVDLFFNPRKYSEMPEASVDTFFTLDEYNDFAGFIFNFTPAEETLSTIQSKYTTSLGYGPQYWAFCNLFNVSLGNNQRTMSPATGAVALMEARIIENKYGGVAPMFLNSDGMGGQIPLVATRAAHKYDKDVQDYFVKINVNPIIMDHTYGVMIVGQKTCKSGALTDRSYIGHEAAFLNFIKEVRENVMFPQIGKHNNDYYRTLRKDQVDQYIAKRVNGTDNIWAAATCDTSTAAGVNDTECQKARKFRINVRVKVTVFSEWVELNFESVDQSVDL